MNLVGAVSLSEKIRLISAGDLTLGGVLKK
jgi:hypothetical protein